MSGNVENGSGSQAKSSEKHESNIDVIGNQAFSLSENKIQRILFLGFVFIKLPSLEYD